MDDVSASSSKGHLEPPAVTPACGKEILSASKPELSEVFTTQVSAAALHAAPKKDLVAQDLSESGIASLQNGYIGENSPQESGPSAVKELASLEPSQDIERKIRQKNGVFWDCVDCLTDVFGDRYVFRISSEVMVPGSNGQLRHLNLPEFNAKIEQCFPAIEPYVEQAQEMIGVPDRDGTISSVSPGSFREFTRVVSGYVREELHFLGYEIRQAPNGTVEIVLPDRDSLLNCWEHLRLEHYQGLPKLSIFSENPQSRESGEGDLSDTAFANAHAQYDIVLSSGREFVHDHLFHVIISLSTEIFKQKYPKYRLAKLKCEIAPSFEQKKQKVKEARTFIESFKEQSLPTSKNSGKLAEQLDACLGIYVDLLTNGVMPNEVNRASPLTMLTSGRLSHLWEPYWKKRFGDVQRDDLDVTTFSLKDFARSVFKSP